MQAADNSFSDYRQAISDPDWFYYTVCGFCRSVCSPLREQRLANRKLIHRSGTAALKLDGSHVIIYSREKELQIRRICFTTICATPDGDSTTLNCSG
ncbi:hypothetical protein [Desulfosarcina ovata]|uniref:Uncharacterized protein n=1 Tax=Desulfosarcina ovata subsp. ovata TaxID=2752305 RepID=A0A5K8AFE8_9BACT|nr:hypothetical protein [Desulfosarcina ovata]BBO91382.1 hypothetical protein DSCOOX_45620 [Desulfosarcina ovata subsp. ovata]